jgi:endoglucanase
MHKKIKNVRPHSALFVTLVSLLVTFGFLVPVLVSATPTVDVWWPTDGAKLASVQPFKTMIKGLDVSQYEMFWQVDGGTLNRMDDNYTDYQHKEALVDVSTWSWHGSGPYVINFVAKQNGNVIAEQTETISLNNGLPTWSPTAAPTTQQQPIVITTVLPATTTTPTPTNSNTPNPIITSTPGSPSVNNSTNFYVNPNTSAASQALAWKTSNPSGAAAMTLLAAQPTASWFGQWNANVQSDAHALVTAAQSKNQIPVLIAYNLPQRDCGGFSAGGSNNPAGYTAWIKALASGIGNAPAIVILEPDGLAQISCLSSADRQTRLDLLSNAIGILKSNAGTKVYLDAGHSNWIDSGTMARNLRYANVSAADGFSLNVSNFIQTNNEVAYGTQVSDQLGGKHFVVDTSRNGNGSNGQWCNPSGMAIGIKPTTQTNNSLVDAFLWLKTPGESDGPCNGGPSAGTWWPSYALQLVQNAH